MRVWAILLFVLGILPDEEENNNNEYEDKTGIAENHNIFKNSYFITFTILKKEPNLFLNM